jgi:hypothetical protein
MSDAPVKNSPFRFSTVFCLTVLTVYVGSIAILADLVGLGLHWTVDRRLLWLAAATIAVAGIAANVVQRLWTTLEGLSASSGLIAMLPRTGIPLLVAIAAIRQDATTGRELFGYIVFFYLVTHPVSVLLSLPRKSQADT